jgi:hypothetical protein
MLREHARRTQRKLVEVAEGVVSAHRLLPARPEAASSQGASDPRGGEGSRWWLPSGRGGARRATSSAWPRRAAPPGRVRPDGDRVVIASLADRYGVRQDQGTVVWFEVDQDRARAESAAGTPR